MDYKTLQEIIKETIEMSIIKSFSFPAGNIRGDMFYIKHSSDNFTVIDCYLKVGNDASSRKDEIIKEIIAQSGSRLRRFISTHPDADHILGLDDLYKKWYTTNFYAVANNIPEEKGNKSLERYLFLKKNHNYPIERGISRKWLNESDKERGGSGLEFLWPDINNEYFRGVLDEVTEGGSPNNISCILRYTKGKASFLWMGDMETDMQKEFFDSVPSIPETTVVFHPHHGRESGEIPEELLKALNPKIIVIGNAPCEHLNYMDTERTITQNTAGDLVFRNLGDNIDIFSSNEYKNPPSCLVKKTGKSYSGMYYMGTLPL